MTQDTDTETSRASLATTGVVAAGGLITLATVSSTPAQAVAVTALVGTLLADIDYSMTVAESTAAISWSVGRLSLGGLAVAGVLGAPGAVQALTATTLLTWAVIPTAIGFLASDEPDA